MTRGRVAAAGLIVALAVLWPAAAASAHPLGNFSVNTYSGLRVERHGVLVDYVVDLAEIPTFQAADAITAQGERPWAASECSRRSARAHLSLDGARVPLRVASSALAFAAGSGGLRVLRLSCVFRADHELGSRAVTLRYRDGNDLDRVGWREVTAVGDGVTLLGSDVPTRSTSQRLTDYPQDLLQSPLRVTGADLRAQPGGRALAGTTSADPGVRTSGLPLGGDRLSARFTSLVARQRIGPLFLVFALGLALMLGAVHALAPGHGKTVMAAYLVGQRGTRRPAVLIGLTVTLMHTAGVLALGVALSASKIVAPERLYPWLTAISGLLFAAIGVSLLIRLRRAARACRHDHHDHDHDDAHDHDHDHVHVHVHGGVAHTHDLPPEDAPISWRSLVGLGLAGGLVPTPSALIVLLGAIALDRIWLGVVLVVVYGMGMAVTLTGIGFALARARQRLEARTRRSPTSRWLAIGRVLPLATASLIVVAGTSLVFRGVSRL